MKSKKDKKAQDPTLAKKRQEKQIKTLLNPKSARLIVRNLPFKCEEESLQNVFSPYGEITDITLPKKEDGKSKGFGFVQFSDLKEAAEAIKALNGQELNGRPIAVDFSLSKSRFEKLNKRQPVGNLTDEPEKEEEIREEENKDDNDDYISKDDVDNEDISEEDDDDEDADDSESTDKDDDESDVDEESDKEDDDSDDKTHANMSDKKNDDAKDGKTVFVRNMSLDSDEAELKELFTHFGTVEYCRIVVDKATQHSRGMAFIKFKDKLSADECVRIANDKSDQGGIFLDDKELSVIVALTRNDTEKLKSDMQKKNAKVDKRNLWLAREGLIRAGTKDAEGITPADLQKRARIEQIKRVKLKDPNVFVSTTRLCIHNIPVPVTDKKLKTIVLKAIDEKKARINECRIMRDLNKLNSKGIGRSRGYAFVNFIEHEHALLALRTLNNNPDIFGDSKRPIVEFSLENKAKLQAREERQQRALAKQTEKQTKKKTKNFKTDTSKTPVEKQKVKGLVLPKRSGAKVRHKPRQTETTKGKKTKKEKRKRAFAEDAQLVRLLTHLKQIIVKFNNQTNCYFSVGDRK
ncbi:DgyrCDS7179 [Dimorphilus gyrociliatus]|uniref:DgyrCDS7179 n=1 Tax=Dimorphilus gyrociliatus TaxID=2664684 RepID=A0A7I8VSJ9_9ANNE|nr:DgyrCDS7179 [Dimorphilus gyrociliatus]